MTRIRRIYVYLLALAGLAMFASACANLLQLLIDVALGSVYAESASQVRDTAALWGAAALVGLPVWLLHWWLAARAARADAVERTSVLRRLYVYLVLGGAMLVLAGSVHDVLYGL